MTNHGHPRIWFWKKIGRTFFLSNSHSITLCMSDFLTAILHVVLGIVFFLCHIYLFHILFGLLFPFSLWTFILFSLWTFISLFYLDIFFILPFSLLYSFLFYRGHILDFFQILYQNMKLHNLNDSINIRYKEMHLYPIHRDVSFCIRNVMFLLHAFSQEPLFTFPLLCKFISKKYGETVIHFL